MPVDSAEELKLLIRSRHPIAMIESIDEPRSVELVERVAREMGLPMFEWSMTAGLRRLLPTASEMLAGTSALKTAMAHVAEITQTAVYLFKSISPHLRDPLIQRLVQDLYQTLTSNMSTMVLVESMPDIPEPLQRMIVPLELSWPDETELIEIVRQQCREAATLYKVTATMTQRQLDQLVQNLRGLTRGEAARIVAGAIYDDLSLDEHDLPRVLAAKRAVVGRGGLLENVLADVEASQLAGLANLKAWLEKRRDGFSREAKAFGLEPPRGILLIGVQGCGKSLCAKVVASSWRMPLLRFDPGVLYQRFVGESEGRLRQALRQAEAMSPVVLWIDEIEKAFASASSESADGGLSQRMFGSFLTWMQDHTSPIFLVATANDISRLPPELVRKGRFDEIFFVDLPDAASRRQMFEIHLARRKRVAASFDLDALAAASEGFSGAEIEQAIGSAMFAAFSQRGEVTTAEIIDELRKTQPLSVVMAERVETLREWAKGRCVPAD